MNQHGKKMIAPIVITALMVLYYLVFFILIFTVIEDLLVIKLILGIVPLGIAGVMIYVCVQRIKEIQEGEEDDLSKY